MLDVALTKTLLNAIDPALGVLVVLGKIGCQIFSENVLTGRTGLSQASQFYNTDGNLRWVHLKTESVVENCYLHQFFAFGVNFAVIILT